MTTHLRSRERTGPDRDGLVAPPIRVRGLVKRFGDLTALDGLELVVRTGEVHGFLGPNGAGKTTTIRSLLGLYQRSAGDVEVLGLDPRRAAAEINRRTAYVAGDVTFWPNFTGAQVLDALAGLRGARDRTAERQLVERFQLDPGKKMRAYSKGNRQKVALVAALSAPVDLLLLDEPTTGLDPLMEQVFGDCVSEASRAGRTVLLSSHILGEVERLCSHVTIIREGRTVESGSLAQMRHLASSTVVARCVQGVADDVARAVGALGVAVERHEIAGGESRLECSVPREDIPGVLAVLADRGVTDVTCTPASLEELFMRHYQVAAP